MKLLLSFFITIVALHAIEKNDFAFERMIEMPSKEGIVKIDLPLVIYNHLNTSNFLDIAIFDADNKTMPHAIEQLDTKKQKIQILTLPFSHVKTIKEKKNTTLNINYQGKKLTLIENSKISDEDYILDASKMKNGIDYIQIKSNDHEYMLLTDIACSNDLSHWKEISNSQMLANITMQDSNITKNRLELNINPCSYLKIHTQKPLNIEMVTAVKAQILILKPTPRSIQFIYIGNGIEFDSSKQLTLNTLQFLLPPKEQFYKLNLFCKNGDEKQWTFIKKITIYTLHNGTINNLQTTLFTNADHYRIEPANDSYLPKDFSLSFSYDPAQLYFIAQGKPPYSLVYGSIKTALPNADLHSMIQLNTDFITATLNEEKVLNSSANKIEKKVNYTSILVWVSLVITLMILGFMSYKLIYELKLNQKENND
ncbi:DUF3999 domain-containing protein [bacterium]|nr:DUF3999 domain-containing protein [bacterium]MBU1883462.1 DUF3999 domain-containing protein [bacterium]